MKRILSVFLILTLLFAPACSSESQLVSTKPMTSDEAETLTAETVPSQPTEEVITVDTYDYPTVCNPLTPEMLSALPLATNDMTTEERRQLCLDYFYLQLTFSWTPNAKYSYVVESSNKKVSLEKGMVYAGIPYVTVGTGNLYRILEDYDSETGVLPVSLYKENPILFGNQCSVGAFWGWGRVINSADYTWTANMVKSNGFITVGPYTYPDDLISFAGSTNGRMTTKDICQENGRDIMFESYAKMLPADGLVQYSGTAGHVRMCSVKPEVKYDANGKIDGNNSFLRYRDQVSKWTVSKQEDGSEMSVQGGVDVKVSFEKLFTSSYLPFTFAELLGTDPVEPSEVKVDLQGDSITIAQLKGGVLTSNYAISDVFLTVFNSNGEEVYEYVKRSTKASVMSVDLSGLVFSASLSKFADGNHTVAISTQISTGEKPTVFTATLQA